MSDKIVKYVLKHPKIKGNLVFGYDHRQLRHFADESDMDFNQLRWLFEHVPLTVKRLQELSDKMGGRLEMIPPDLSFEAFWNTYNKKINKKRCEPLWKKMTDAERIQCLMNIKAYHAFLQRNPSRAKLDPENYLKRGSYQNDWGKVG